MLTVVVYVVVTLIVATALFVLSIVVFGRSELLPAVRRGHTITALPEGPLSGDDLRAVRFGISARGYTMTEVDWALEQAATEIDRLRTLLGEESTVEENASSASHGLDPESAPASAHGPTR